MNWLSPGDVGFWFPGSCEMSVILVFRSLARRVEWNAVTGCCSLQGGLCAGLCFFLMLFMIYVIDLQDNLNSDISVRSNGLRVA